MGALPRGAGRPSRGAPLRRGLRAAALLGPGLAAAACGSPTGPDDVPPGPVHSVAAVVFVDEDGDGLLDAGERGRLPAVEVEIAGRVASSGADGTAVVPGVPEGLQTVSARLASLPPFFEPGSVSVTIPAGRDVAVPVRWPVNGKRLHVYMASGDSISEGFGSSDLSGYRESLARQLQARWLAPAQVPYPGPGGGNSGEALLRIDADLASVRPAYVLIQWGVNDWLVPGCQPDPAGCAVLDNIRAIVERVQAFGSLACLATITPVNVGANDQAPAFREEWVRALNEQIRALAAETGALLVDVHAAFEGAGPTSSLFVDHVHPNAAGYEVIAGAYFRALTRPR